jgi:lipopolysaccharide transport system ATP-binding protein
LSSTVIRLENIGKRYRVGAEAGGLLRDRIAEAVRDPLGLVRKKPRETFWALKDISFEVQEGEVLGLIGRNGAGKSTLLKVLARITKPTVGRAEIHGRVGSLLEVGTGFHPELTGRENVFLNGAILGMGRREIARKFGEIVAFAEVEKFIDTPVKYYSSGMYIRLAFAVAAHLETEILFVDEVLSVGDVSFQKKCLGKMGDVARLGRTVIFISHNMAAINALCGRCMMLREGEVLFDGSPATATARYYEDSLPKANENGNLVGRPRREGNGKGLFRSVRLQALGPNGEELPLAYPGCDVRIEAEVESLTDFEDANLAVIFWDANSYRVIDTNIAQKGKHLSLKAGQKACAEFVVREVLLKPGSYFLSLWLGRWPTEVFDHVDAVTLEIAESEETSRHSEIFPGVYLCRFDNDLTID